MENPTPCLKPVRPSPKFAHWLFKRRISFVEAASELRCTPAYVSALCLPFDDPNRRQPGPAFQKRIAIYTDGAVQPNDWFQPSELVAA